MSLARGLAIKILAVLTGTALVAAAAARTAEEARAILGAEGEGMAPRGREAREMGRWGERETGREGEGERGSGGEREMGRDGKTLPAERLREASPDRAPHSAPDILLLDLNLPVMDGMTFLEEMRRAHRMMPVVILTGHGDLEAARKAIHLEVVEFLCKPCHLGEIEQALGRCRHKLAGAGPVERSSPAGEGATSLAESERTLVLEALRRHGGNRSAAARDLGISRRTLYNKVKAYEAEGWEVPGESVG